MSDKKITELYYILNSIKHEIDFIAITDKWKKDSDIQYFNFKNFNAIFNNRKTRGGGVCLLVNDKYDFKMFSEIRTEKINILCVRINLLSECLYVSVVYRSPCDTVQHFDEFFKLYNEHLKKLNNKKTLIVGDFNINLLQDNNIRNKYEQINNCNNIKNQ